MPATAEIPNQRSLPANILALLRVDDEFLLRTVELTGVVMNGDFVRGMLWNSLWTANVRHLTRSSTTLQYASLYQIPPDELRRPIGVSALAAALKLPYETVRRHIIALENDDMCRRIPGKGVVVPAATLEGPRLLATVQPCAANVQRFIADLARAGFDYRPYRPAAASETRDAAMIARAMIRLHAEYTLQTLAVLRASFDGELMPALIFVAITAENLRQITASPANVTYGAIDAAIPDDLRRPISVLAVSNSLMIPYETVRRAINRMERAGLVRRLKSQGLIVTSNTQGRLQTRDVARRRLAHIETFVRDLQQIGLPLPA